MGKWMVGGGNEDGIGKSGIWQNQRGFDPSKMTRWIRLLVALFIKLIFC